MYLYAHYPQAPLIYFSPVIYFQSRMKSEFSSQDKRMSEEDLLTRERLWRPMKETGGDLRFEPPDRRTVIKGSKYDFLSLYAFIFQIIVRLIPIEITTLPKFLVRSSFFLNVVLIFMYGNSWKIAVLHKQDRFFLRLIKFWNWRFKGDFRSFFRGRFLGEELSWALCKRFFSDHHKSQ